MIPLGSHEEAAVGGVIDLIICEAVNAIGHIVKGRASMYGRRAELWRGLLQSMPVRTSRHQRCGLDS